jgi:hypothetical protein
MQSTASEDPPGAVQLRARNGELSHRATAEHRDRIARLDLRQIRAEVRRRKNVREQDRLLVRHRVRQFHQVRRGVRDARVLRLQPVEPSALLAAAVIRRSRMRPLRMRDVALRLVARAAVGAIAATDRRRHHHPVSRPEIPDVPPDLLDHAHRFVPENRPGLQP